MKKLVGVLLGLVAVVFLVNFSLAAEHPGKRSEKAATKEHPGEEQPGEEHPGEKELLPANQIIMAIKDHINKVTEENRGYFPLYDSKERKDLRLKLIRVHEDRVSYIKKQDAYFACTDFLTDDDKTTYDIDFWMRKGRRSGRLIVYRTKIHKKDGKPRFIYQEDEVVPVEEGYMAPEASS